MKKIYLALPLFLTACGGVGAEKFDAQGLTVADEKMVSNCRFLGDVTGLSAFYGVFAGPAYSTARGFAASEARELGATHLVFTSSSTGYAGTQVSGRAYKCGK